jgi:hypothetical protein
VRRSRHRYDLVDDTSTFSTSSTIGTAMPQALSPTTLPTTTTLLETLRGTDLLDSLFAEILILAGAELMGARHHHATTITRQVLEYCSRRPHPIISFQIYIDHPEVKFQKLMVMNVKWKLPTPVLASKSSSYTTPPTFLVPCAAIPREKVELGGLEVL